MGGQSTWSKEWTFTMLYTRRARQERENDAHQRDTHCRLPSLLAGKEALSPAFDQS